MFQKKQKKKKKTNQTNRQTDRQIEVQAARQTVRQTVRTEQRTFQLELFQTVTMTINCCEKYQPSGTRRRLVSKKNKKNDGCNSNHHLQFIRYFHYTTFTINFLTITWCSLFSHLSLSSGNEMKLIFSFFRFFFEIKILFN